MSAKVDRRDLILARLVEIFTGFTMELLGGENGAVVLKAGSVVHNRDELPKELVPGIIVLDGDETKDTRALPPPGRGAPVSPQIMRMTPEIYVVLDVRKPQNKNVGEDLDAVRAAIVNLVLADSQLPTLVGQMGQIIYDGCVTDLARNRTMRGQMGLSFTFVYPFIPGEFQGA